ncbi:MAG: glutamate-1-semialdehyde 2,1-aminomutase [archaeon]|nr:glutamate-1-semialdehyde 2,1-aminomutase [archaeon]
MRKDNRSKKLFSRARKYFVGGVNSPVRSFKGVGKEYPLFISKTKGSIIRDEDGNEYLDYVCSWGASILGSAYPLVEKAVVEAAKRGLSFGAATDRESDLAERIQKSMPSIELMRLVSSGTEATMSAIRLARAFTKKDKIIKFEGCYHGHSDSFLVRAGSGLATFSMPDSAGVPDSIASNTLVARFNDLDSVSKIALQNKYHVACIIVEPVAGNMGVIPPEVGFLEGLRQLCNENEILLIFDEVITGFRVARGGAQSLYNVTPDLTCLGKVIGGGMNIAAYGGRKDIMQLVSPLGPVYQAGTLSGNPIAVAAGIATLDALKRSVYSKLETNSQRLASGISNSADKSEINVKVQRVGSMLGLFFYSNEKFKGTAIKNYDDIKNKCSKDGYSRFFNEMLNEGIYLPPSAFETIFVSAAHSTSDISKTIKASQVSFEKMKGNTK